MSLTASERQPRLDFYYQQIHAIILARQNPITGLLPASTAINAHGDYTDAWVRDNVYSILAVWGLAIAYRKIDDVQGRTYELEHSTVKLMRGLLYSMMRQSEKVEKFKQTQSLLDSLHAKFDTRTGDTVVGDEEWGHLQLDATSLYLLMLAQMTVSGLKIIYTIDEVNFIQNLVYYIGRAYRTPDYGIWERGNKINKGNPELNASSVGMALAALEAINGVNLFGMQGSQSSVIHVMADEIARARTTLESLLPRESSSKEVDAALLSVLTFPAFAVEDKQLAERTRRKIVEKLQGKYGCKRFLRDGHQTVLEDTDRLHYEPWELKQFEHIECEWPLFFTYFLLDGLFRGDRPQIQEYKERLESLVVEWNGFKLLPEVYYVPEERIEAERENPLSQPRQPNENLPLVWAQSLYFLGLMLDEGLLDRGELDPLGRHRHPIGGRKPVVQIALLAEDEALQTELSDRGIATQTPAEVEPIQVRQARQLSNVYQQIGRNDKLGLTGRPIRRLRSLITSNIFRIRGETIVFLPSFLDQQEFYLTLDYHFLVSQIKSELAYIHRHWWRYPQIGGHGVGRPTMTLLLTHAMLETDGSGGGFLPALLELMNELRDGNCEGTPVKLGRLNQLMFTGSMERIDFLHDFEFKESAVKNAEPVCYFLAYHPEKNKPLSNLEEFCLECETDLKLLLSNLRQSENLYEQIELLHTLCRLEGLDFETGLGGPNRRVTVADLLNEVYFKAGTGKGLESCSTSAETTAIATEPTSDNSSKKEIHWAVVRRAAGLLNKVDIGLSDAVTDILVRQKQITVGKAYSEAAVIHRPMSHTEIMEKIRQFCGEDIRDRVLTQEILIYVGLLIKSEPELFDGLLSLRVSYLALLLTSELAQELHLTQDEAYERLMELSPFEVKNRLHKVIEGYAGMNQLLRQQESIQVTKSEQDIDWVVSASLAEPQEKGENWHRRRQLDGAACRVPKEFYPRVWEVMRHCKGLVIGDKLERRNRLDSELILSEMTPGEKNFALRVEHLLNKIQAPEYRQVNIETLMELAAICDRNPDLQIEQYIVLDVLIGHAVRLAWLDSHPNRRDRYDEDKAVAWRSFYDSSPYVCATFVVKAFRYLMKFDKAIATV
ncbi:glycoside hydrolase family 15 protein [Phormidium sp. CCY1219]|uniref:glycoside hydrolase family 15 protein n=1 Tax=Phormidium sp. CCY1219 TaxID=2886104 RepID=UPI002D1F19A1|nr:glycoside hydrolase family 15 protein [Phormidium sp. CCY1219]MEB3828298.1 glycoside hydrolase family 15 protein [Phormidium sp. CCY1219]